MRGQVWCFYSTLCGVQEQLWLSFPCFSTCNINNRYNQSARTAGYNGSYLSMWVLTPATSCLYTMNIINLSTRAWVQILAWGLSGWSSHVLTMSVLVLNRYSNFPPVSMHIRIIWDYKLSIGLSLSVDSVCVLRWTSDLPHMALFY